MDTSLPELWSFRFVMHGMFAAETAVLVHFQTIRRVLFVLDRVVISLFAL
jgi:hypothetical protein